MAITEVASAVAAAASGGASITHGFTLLSGDVVVAVLHTNGDGYTIADNNGAHPFSKDYSADAGSASAMLTVFSRGCGASEPSSYAFTNPANSRWTIVLVQLRGVDTSDVYDVEPAFAVEDSTNPITVPTWSTGVDGAQAYVALTYDGAWMYWGSPTNGFAESGSDDAQQSLGVFGKNVASAGAVGATAFTPYWSGDLMQAFRFALRPAVASSLSIPLLNHLLLGD